jgi:hypothetical protein
MLFPNKKKSVNSLLHSITVEIKLVEGVEAIVELEAILEVEATMFIIRIEQKE